eukprot:4526906-Prymnesium_polylepis.1
MPLNTTHEYQHADCRNEPSGCRGAPCARTLPPHDPPDVPHVPAVELSVLKVIPFLDTGRDNKDDRGHDCEADCAEAGERAKGDQDGHHERSFRRQRRQPRRRR